jgi:hypothetical protein
VEQNFLMYSAPALLKEWLKSFKEFPPRHKPASFSIDRSAADPTIQVSFQRAADIRPLPARAGSVENDPRAVMSGPEFLQRKLAIVPVSPVATFCFDEPS